MTQRPVHHWFQQGFAAIAAIFLVVVLAALGAFMLTFSNTQQLTSAQDVQGSRAYWAARAGLEWGIANVVATDTCDASTTLPTIDAFFAVTVRCNSTLYSAPGPVTIYRFESTAKTTGSAPGSIGYIERSVSASMER